MSERFYSSEPITAEIATLRDTEAHHLLHVMRGKVGDEVTLFDGSGVEFAAVVTATTRKEVELEITARQAIDRELPAPLVMGIAIPKGDRQKWLVEKLTELGVTTLVPLMTERSVAALKGSALVKLRRGVIEASKQCRRNRLMTISDPQPLADFLASETYSTSSKLFAHPSGESLTSSIGLPATVAIGPEGGFSEAETQQAIEHGWQALGLGPRILRIETAAAALAARLAIQS